MEDSGNAKDGGFEVVTRKGLKGFNLVTGPY
jgi:hypothetical protein